MRLDVAFDLDFSLCCGQVFRWRKVDGWWYGVVGEKVVKVRQCGSELKFENVSEEFCADVFWVKRRFSSKLANALAKTIMFKKLCKV